MMIKLACIDKRAVERLKLVEIIELALIDSRDEGGFHLNISPMPLSKEEALVSFGFDTILFGSGFAPEEVLVHVKQLRSAFENIPIIVQVLPENYTISNVRQLKRYVNSVVSTGDSYQRLLLTISEYAELNQARDLGALITFQSAKGGVGCTSIAVALAHCAGALGKSSIYVDLSQQADGLHFLNAAKISSRELTSFIRGEIRYDETIVDKMLHELPNGLTVLLQPEGGTDIRELWLRDTNKLEAILQIFESLQARFDNVVVDIGQTEGIVPFALSARANSRIIVTSNDPSSIHLNSLLLERHTRLIPLGVYVIVNRLVVKGLTDKDVNNYFETKCGLSYSKLPAVDYDSSIRSWVASGNTPLTVGRKEVRKKIEETFCILNKITTTKRVEEVSNNSWFKGRLKALPAPMEFLAIANSNIQTLEVPPFESAKLIQFNSQNIINSETLNNQSVYGSESIKNLQIVKINSNEPALGKLAATGEFKIIEDFIFEGELSEFEITPPRLAEQVGSCSLEQALLLTGAMMGIVGVYGFCSNLAFYIESLQY